MRPSELGVWAALWRINPWGEQRADRRAGEVAAVLANVHRNSKVKRTPFLAEDFMPYMERKAPPPPTKPQEVNHKVLMALGLTIDQSKVKRK